MVGIPAPLYRKLIEEGKGVWIEHPTFGKVFQAWMLFLVVRCKTPTEFVNT